MVLTIQSDTRLALSADCTTPHPRFAHLLPQGEKASTEELRFHGLLPLWEKVAKPDEGSISQHGPNLTRSPGPASASCARWDRGKPCAGGSIWASPRQTHHRQCSRATAPASASW